MSIKVPKRQVKVRGRALPGSSACTAMILSSRSPCMPASTCSAVLEPDDSAEGNARHVVSQADTTQTCMAERSPASQSKTQLRQQCGTATVMCAALCIFATSCTAGTATDWRRDSAHARQPRAAHGAHLVDHAHDADWLCSHEGHGHHWLLHQHQHILCGTGST